MSAVTCNNRKVPEGAYGTCRIRLSVNTVSDGSHVALSQHLLTFPVYIGGTSLTTDARRTLSREKVLVSAKAQPCWKARLIMALLVVGAALARPNGCSKCRPHSWTETSTRSIGVWNSGRRATSPTLTFHNDYTHAAPHSPINIILIATRQS